MVTAVLYMLNNKTADAKELSKENMHHISFMFLKPETVTKKEVVKEVIKEEIKKTVSKPIVKKVKTPKKIDKKIEKIVETQQPKKIQQVVKKTVKTQTPAKKEVVASVDKSEIDLKQKAFMLKIRELINANKFYPKSARRRGIEGEVKLKFNILANGCVKSIKMLSGKNIFEKSAVQAVQKSFPIVMNEKLYNFPKEFSITLVYKLKA
jgi:protein TonB